MALFPNETGLTAVGANVFEESNVSGESIILCPDESNAGEIFQGYLESFNADSTTLVIELLKAQRGYEMWGMRCVVRLFK